MKIAVIIAGQPRSYQKGYEYLKRNLLDRYECDVFYHTWYNNLVTEHDIDMLYQPVMRKMDVILPSRLDLWNEIYINTPNAKDFPPANAVASFMSLFEANLLRIQHQTLMNIHYDVVVKTRFDYALNVAIHYEELMEMEPKRWPQTIFIPDCRMVPTYDFGNDQFAFGSSSTMTKYCSTYLHLIDFYQAGVQMNGEAMMQATLRLYGLTGDNLVYVNMKNPFPPGKYNGTPHSLIRDDFELWKNA